VINGSNYFCSNISLRSVITFETAHVSSYATEQEIRDFEEKKKLKTDQGQMEYSTTYQLLKKQQD
jgi:hypothetical protein